MSRSIESELAALSARVAALEAENAALRNAPRLASRPALAAVRDENPASVRFEPTPAPDGRMPVDGDLSELMKITLAAYPQFAPRDWSPNQPDKHLDYFAAFKNAFRFQLNIPRGEIDLVHTVGYWSGQAETWMFSKSMAGEIGAGHLTAAIIASGDVPFLDPRQYFPWGQHFGLLVRGEGGRPATSQAWRRILATGRAPSPSDLAPRQYEARKVQLQRT